MKAGVLLVLVALLVSACSDTNPTGLETSDVSPAPAGVLLSDPLATSTVVGLSGYRSSVSVATDANFAYISVAPQTFPSGIVVDIRNVTTASEPRRVRITDGGWDPVALEASVDDEIELTVWFRDRGATILTIKVPRRRPPAVVRSDPPKGRVDVALNQLVTVVFSEPIDATSLNSTSFQLQLNGTPIAGSISIASDGLTAEFLSDQALQPGVTYDLAVTQSVKDLEGDPLADGYTSSFTTERTPLAPTNQVTGTVLVRTAEGVTPLGSTPEQRVTVDFRWVYGNCSGCGNPYVPVNADGTYRYAEAPPRSLVYLTAYADGYDQPCFTTMQLTGSSATLDIELVSRSRPLPQFATGGSVISGVIYEKTPQGDRRPIQGASVVVDWMADVDGARTTTDENGRYALCEVPHKWLSLSVFKQGYNGDLYREIKDFMNGADSKQLDIELIPLTP